jgi:hypothetical protein
VIGIRSFGLLGAAFGLLAGIVLTAAVRSRMRVTVDASRGSGGIIYMSAKALSPGIR